MRRSRVDLPQPLESMLRKPDGGAIAIIAPSREGIPVFHEEEDFRLMVTEGKMDGTTETLTRFWQHALSGESTVGEAFRNAKADMTQHAKKTDGYHFVQCELNLLGDPSLDPRSTPPESIDARVSITDKGGIASFIVENVPGCRVCVWDGDTNYDIVDVDDSGSVFIPKTVSGVILPVRLWTLHFPFAISSFFVDPSDRLVVRLGG